MSKSKSKIIIKFLLLSALLAIILAYIAQFIFDYQPCVLCLYQRAPFFSIIGICTLVLFFRNKKIHDLVIFCSILLLLINAGIASYQVGVEKKIFKGPDTCSSRALENITDLELLKTALIKTKAVRCDEPEFFFLTLSMAAWNAIYCLILSLMAILLYRRR